MSYDDDDPQQTPTQTAPWWGDWNPEEKRLEARVQHRKAFELAVIGEMDARGYTTDSRWDEGGVDAAILGPDVLARLWKEAI